MVERIDKLGAPPVVGQWYLVPAIKWDWHALRMDNAEASPSAIWWPVMGEKHDDAEFFDFKHQHYHTDVRFLHSRHARKYNNFREIIGRPLYDENRSATGPSAPVLRRMRCKRLGVDFDAEINRGTDWRTGKQFETPPQIIRLRAAYAGVQCKKNEQGWVCPHRRAALASIVPVDGVITCPLHGLRINAETGNCMAGA